MPTASTARRCLVALGATASLLCASAAAVVMGTGGTTGAVQVAAVTGIAPEPTTSTTAAPTTTSTSTSTSTTSTSTTSTTVKPRPTTVPRPPTTRAAVRTTVPATTPPTAAPAPAPAVAASTSSGDRCRAALQFAADHGVLLPAGWGFRCPGSAVVAGADHWGLACFNCEGTGNWIAVEADRIGPSDATLRYVVTHETCHAIDYVTLGITTEVGADLCAALHGAPRP